MLSTDPKTMNLVALGVAKLTYGSLSTIAKYLGNDLELGLIGFAVVLRTRKDWFAHIERHTMSEEVVGAINTHTGFTTSVYEISQFTGINRATVRRKLKKLEDIGILEQLDERRWHLIDFGPDDTSGPALMLRELLEKYVTVTHALERLLPDEVDHAKKTARGKGFSFEPAALSDNEIKDKIKRGNVV